MKFILSILFILSLFNGGKSHAQSSSNQEREIDSLKQVIKNAKHDTTIVKAWIAWDNIIYASNPSLDLILNKKIDSLSEQKLSKALSKKNKLFFQKSSSSASNILGTIYDNQGDYKKAIEYYSKSLKVSEEIGDKKGIAKSLNNLGTIYDNQGDYKKAIERYSKSLKISEEIGDKNVIAALINNLGRIYDNQGNYKKAIEYYSKSLKISEEIGDKDVIATSLNNLGHIYKSQGDYKKAIEYYSKSLKISEEIGDKNGIATSISNLGSIYDNQEDYEKAIEYYSKSLEISEETGDKNVIAASINNLGSIYDNQGDYKKAIEYYSKSLKISEEIGDKNGIAKSLNNLGTISDNQGDYKKAIECYSKSLKISEEIGNKNGIAMSLSNLGGIYKSQGDYKKAWQYGARALSIFQEIGALLRIKQVSSSLWEVNKKLGRFKESLAIYELYIESRDSLDSEENQKAVIRQEYKYQYEKQAAADSVKNTEAKKVIDAELKATKAENAQQKLKAEQEEQQKYVLSGVLALAVLFGLFIFNRFRVTRKQRDIIDIQKQEVEIQKEKVDEAYDKLEEKNTEILDSINYAKRIQRAILPPDKLVKQYLQDSFILYKPKDIVAGDFYWLEPTENGVLFAAADCTGHGVPGAMVSVVCNNGLNRCVREYDLTEPGEILDKTREIVISEFEKSEEEVKDGMDIALCSLHSRVLKYAGAHNPLWIIRKDSKVVQEIKAHKQPIGKYGAPSSYPTHTIELKEGDSFYIFSDGYADQFGGENGGSGGKKFKTANFKRLLLSIQNETIARQKELVDEAFKDWMGWGGHSIEQLDDVCVIGVRV